MLDPYFHNFQKLYCFSPSKWSKTNTVEQPSKPCLGSAMFWMHWECYSFFNNFFPFLEGFLLIMFIFFLPFLLLLFCSFVCFIFIILFLKWFGGPAEDCCILIDMRLYIYFIYTVLFFSNALVVQWRLFYVE